MNMDELEYKDLEGEEDDKEKESFYEFFVAGVKFHKLHTCLNEVQVGECLMMVTEPSNKYDPNAVRLEYASFHLGEEVMIGYVPAKISASVSAAMMISDLKAEVIEVNPSAKTWEQLKVAIKET